MSITVTAAAAKYIQAILQRHPEAVGLRFGIKPSGCAEYRYVVDIARIIEDGDKVFECSGVKIVVNQTTLEKINGTEIDYKTAGLNSSLIFNNPHAANACGCGESFTLTS